MFPPMDPATTVCRALQGCEDPAFDAFLACYAEAIPARERKPEEALADMAGRQDYLCLVLEANTRLLGFSILIRMPSEPVLLLEYMGIVSDLRGQGLGARLFRLGLEAARSRFGALPCLVEVDSPREPAPDLAQRIQRMRFYRRLGCRLVAGLAYVMPLSGAGQPPAMDLLVHATEASASVPRGRVEAWLKALYCDVYHCGPEDGRIRAMVQPLPDPVSLT
jgi:GNAT superfamily N-acetyltransferase